MVRSSPREKRYPRFSPRSETGTNDRGRDGDEIEDFIEEEQITTSKPRRRSNSNSHVTNGNAAGVSGAVKSKFEVNDIDEEAVEAE